jgi:hypothetical protein
MAQSNKTKAIIILTSLLAIGGIAYFVYSKYHEKKMAEIYKKSVDEMVKKYQVFNNPEK